MRQSTPTQAIGYVRISTNENKQKHSIDHQKEQIRKYCEYEHIKLKRVVIEKASAKDLKKRPKLRETLQTNCFDILICTKIDRLARNNIDLQNVVNRIQENGKEIIFIENKIDTTTAQGKMFLQMMGIFAEFEANIISERTKAGLETARRKGVILGRPKKRSTLSGEKITSIRAMRKGRKKWREIAEKLGYRSTGGVMAFWKRNKKID